MSNLVSSGNMKVMLASVGISASNYNGKSQYVVIGTVTRILVLVQRPPTSPIHISFPPETSNQLPRGLVEYLRPRGILIRPTDISRSG